MKKRLQFPSVVLLSFLALATSIISCKTETDGTETEPTYYTVSFDSDGGTEVTSQSIESGKTAVEPKSPTKDGYTFTAWYKGETKFDFSTPITSNITLKAKWSKNTTYYTVTYKSDYGTIPDTLKNGISLAENTILTDEQLPALTDDNAVFKGWYDGDTKAVAGEYAVTKNVTLTALWSDEAKVSYASVFGTVPTSFSAKLNHTLTTENLASVTCSPYTFFGWFYAKDENGNGTGTQAQVGEKITTDTTLYAKWQTATINFETQFGEVPSIIKYTGEKISDSEITTLSETGYTFGGWFKDSTQLTSDYTVTDNVTFTAKWTANTYTVTFSANGGTGSDTTQDFTFGMAKNLNVNTFTRTGYTFTGWAKSTNAIEADYADKAEFTTPAQNTTLYAVWNANEYTITFDANHGTGETVTQTVTFGKTEKLNACPFSYMGYRLASWNTAQDESGSSYSDGGDFSVTEAGDITLYAQWVEADRYIITYKNTKGAENASPTSYRASEGATLSDLTATGYLFDGWYSSQDANGNGTGTKITSWGANEKSGDVTLYAKWEANKYKITFNANGGTPAAATQTVTYGKTEKLNANAFTYAGYRFTSWNTAQDGSGSSYSDGGDFAVTETNNTTLYAQWTEADRFIITYANTRGATNSNPTSYRETIGATISDLSLTGYTFEGWYSSCDADGNGTGTKIISWNANEKSGDITLYAKWKVNEYKVTFNANNGTSETTTQTITYGKTEKLNACSFTYAGYRFTSWNAAQDGSGLSYSDGGDFAMSDTNDITLYAQWTEKDPCVITYANTRGATNSNPTSYRETIGATLSDLSLTGYLFDGWYSSSDSEGNGIGTKITSWGANEKSGDLTLWAKWSPRTDTAYKAEHYKENADDDGYTLAETENLTGTTDSATSAKAKSYENFTAQSVSQDTISADGSTVVKIYYKRNIVTMTFNLDGGKIGEKTSVTLTGKYGSAYAAVGTPAKQGYTFAAWTPALPEAMQGGTFTATYTPNTDTPYKVYHYQENADDDGYTLKDTDNMTGTTATLTNAAAKSYEHFAAGTVTQENIAADGSTEIRINYEREKVTFTLDLVGGTLDGESGTVEKIGKYGQTAIINEPTRTGYNFEGWNTVGGGIPSIYENSVILTAIWTAVKEITIEVQISDISVTKSQNGNTLTFTAESCDNYSWNLDDVEVGTHQSYNIDTLSLKKGTYTLSLEAQKGGKWYSYFAQITVTE